jgi:molybdate transport system regulatory protein
MNVLQGVIVDVITEDEISLVNVRVADQVFSALVIDTPASSSYLAAGRSVRLLFKETETIIARVAPAAISIPNAMPCRILKITKGKILCELALDLGNGSSIHSIITRIACESLELLEEDKVTALILTNEISLSAYD